jgi:hypothetical protein
MARKSHKKKSGRVAVRIALVCGLVGAGAGLLTAVPVIVNMSGAVSAGEGEFVRKGWIAAFVVALVAGGLGALCGWILGGVGARLTDLLLATSKPVAAAPRCACAAGDDEITALGRSLHWPTARRAAAAAERGRRWPRWTRWDGGA